MEGVLQMIRHTGNSTQKKQKLQKQQILDEIKEVSRRLACVERWFEMESDSDMIEACIYERESLCARYRCLLRKARQSELFSSPFCAKIAVKGDEC